MSCLQCKDDDTNAMNLAAAQIDDALQHLPFSLRRWVRRNVYRSRTKQMRELCSQSGAQAQSNLVQHGCVFIHIPKTGGISVAEALFGSKTGGHRTLRDYQLVLDSATLGDAFTFAFVRNPWDRLASAYRFLKAGGRNAYDARWAAQHLANIDSFDAFVRQWLNRKSIWSRQHFWPQYWFVQDQPGQIGVDFIGRFEQLADDYAVVRARLGIGAETLPHSNRGDDRGQCEDLYSPETAAIVADIYRTDIELFEYEADAPHDSARAPHDHA